MDVKERMWKLKQRAIQASQVVEAIEMLDGAEHFGQLPRDVASRVFDLGKKQLLNGLNDELDSLVSVEPVP